MSDNSFIIALAVASLAVIMAIAGIVLPESAPFPETFPYGNLTDVPSTFPYGNLTGYSNTLPYANLTGYPNSFPYANLTDVPQTFPYGNLTGYSNSLPYGNLTGVPNIDLMHGLCLWLPFDSVGLDKSGYRLDGSVVGATYQTGVFSKALNFSGLTDGVDITASSLLDYQGLPFSISFWLNWTGASSRRYIWDNRGTGSIFIIIVDPTNILKMIAVDNNNDEIAAFYTINTNTFYHAVCVFDSSANYLRLYLNGSLVHSVTWTDKVGGSSSGTKVVGNAVGRLSGYNFCGILDEFRVYNRVLKSSEILALYNLPI